MRNEQDAIRRLLTEVEATLHAQGWEMEYTFLAVILKAPEGFSIRESTLNLGDDPLGQLGKMGHMMAEHPTDASLAVAKHFAAPGFYGLCMVGEGIVTSADLVSLAPARIRLVTAIDVTGTIYRIERVKDIGYKTYDSRERDDLGDDLFHALRQMTLAITRHLPNGDRYLDALTDMKMKKDTSPGCEPAPSTEM